ncbi:MAG: hypothetical protein AAF363_14385 [Bacteroidota bacterium]
MSNEQLLDELYDVLYGDPVMNFEVMNAINKQTINMETLTITPPEGQKIVIDEENGAISFKPKPKSPVERIKTIKDILDDNKQTQEALDNFFKHVPAHLKDQYIAELLCKSLNEEWEANWSDEDQPKYYPWFYMDPSGFRFDDCDYWGTFSYVGSRLCFKSKELAEYAGKQFTDLYRKFMIIN